MLSAITLEVNFDDWAYECQVIALSLFINTYLARLLPNIEAIVLIIHVVGFFGILIPLIYLAPKSSVSDVFETFINSGGWSTDGLAFFVGSIQAMFSLIGKCISCHTCANTKRSLQASMLPHIWVRRPLIQSVSREQMGSESD